MTWARGLLAARSAIVRGNSRSFFKGFTTPKEPATGLFGNKILRSPDGFRELNKMVRVASAQLVARIENGDPSRKTVQLFDDLSNEICVSADLVECVRQMHTDLAYKEAAETSAQDFCELVESLNTYVILYKRLAESRDKEKLDNVDLRTLQLFLDDFEQSGVHLPDEQRKKFVELSSEIFQAGARFQWGCDRSVKISEEDQRKYQMPFDELEGAYGHTGNADRRMFSYSRYMQHSQEQENHLRELVGRRHELAKLCGYESFSHRAQFNSLLGSYDTTQTFLATLVNNTRDAVSNDIELMLKTYQEIDPRAKNVGEWDIGYLMGLYKDRHFGAVRNGLAKHFTMGNILNGFEHIVNSLYDVRFEYETPMAGEVWPGNVIKFNVLNKKNDFLGTVYMDIDRRPTKAVGDCHYTVRCSKELESGEWQTPVVMLSFSITNPGSISDWRRAVVGFSQSENLFHELGHAMHSILGRTRYQHVAGTRCPQDLAEVPSILMEHFFNDPRILREVLSQDGKMVTADEVQHLVNCRSSFNNFELVQQAQYAIFDLLLHGPDVAPALVAGEFSSTDFYQRICERALPQLERHPQSAFHHRFHHLVQYGGKYYSYMVARASASLVWRTLFKENPLDKAGGSLWAEAQSFGGGVPSGQVLSHVIGYAPTMKDLIDSLQNEYNQ